MLPARVLIIDNGSIYLAHLKKLCGQSLAAVARPGELNVAKAENYDAIFLSGGYQHEVMESEDFYANEIELISRGRVPIIGICLGFQLIAHAFGMPVHKLARTEQKILDIKPSKLGEKVLGTGPFKVYEDHRWVVTKTPANFHELAYSKDGIEAFEHAFLSLIGFQFHPEMFVTKSDGRNILLKLLTNLAH